MSNQMPIEATKGRNLKNFTNKIMNDIQPNALKLRKVIITSISPNDAELSNVYISCENSYFSVSRYVILNKTTMVEQCILDTMSEVLENMPVLIKEKEKVFDTQLQKKFNISYLD